VPRPSVPAATDRPAAVTRVAATVAALDGLAARPLAEHPDVYEQVHRELRAVLAQLDGA
jgi:hypothetical protein